LPVVDVCIAVQDPELRGFSRLYKEIYACRLQLFQKLSFGVTNACDSGDPLAQTRGRYGSKKCLSAPFYESLSLVGDNRSRQMTHKRYVVVIRLISHVALEPLPDCFTGTRANICYLKAAGFA
jgi:hypothetical protein